MKKQKWKLTFGIHQLPERWKVKPVGRLFILGKYLSIEETENYLQSMKEERK